MLFYRKRSFAFLVLGAFFFVASSFSESFALMLCTSLRPSESESLRQVFERENPDVKIAAVRLHAQDLVKKIVAEAREGKKDCDVIISGLVATGTYLQELKNGYLARYYPLAGKVIPEELRDPEGYWTAVYQHRFGIVYSPEIFPIAPSFQDLAREREQKLLIDSRNPIWYLGLRQYFGATKAREFLKGLTEGKAVGAINNIIPMVIASKRASAGIASERMVKDLKGKGALIEWSEKTRPIISSTGAVFLSRGSNLEQAKRFADFVLSSGGQGILERSGYFPVRSDMQKMSPGAHYVRQVSLKEHQEASAEYVGIVNQR